MDKNSQLDCYMFYMWNEWSEDECISIFGERLGRHIWSKWEAHCDDYTSSGAVATIYASLDADKRRKIVERAIAHYNS